MGTASFRKDILKAVRQWQASQIKGNTSHTGCEQCVS